MAGELIRPHVVNFLDLMLNGQWQTLRDEQLEIAGPPWAGHLLSHLQLQTKFSLGVLAVKSKANEQIWIKPADTVVIQPGGAVIPLADIQRARRIAEPAASLIS